MEQTVATLSEETNMSNSLVHPTVISDVTLLAPGIWTGCDNQKTRYTPDTIRQAFLNTNWEGMNLFLDHQDTKGPAAAYWIGFIKNVQIVGEELHGDLEIWHPLFSMFIKTAKASFGVSMTMDGKENFDTGADYSDFEVMSFRSGSLVDEPGCEVSWLPKMLNKGGKNSKTVLAGNIPMDKIKELSSPSNDTQTSDKNPASNDVGISESSDSENNSDEEDDNCKEVKKMTDEVNQESKEEQKEEAETKEESKEETKVEAEAESSTETEDKEEVKELSAKVDKLSGAVEKLTGLVEKSLAAGDETKEESEEKEDDKSTESEEESKEESKDDDELESTKAELEETKKELATAKAELDKPDEKSLAAGSNSANASDANSGMLGFLRKNAHLD